MNSVGKHIREILEQSNSVFARNDAGIDGEERKGTTKYISIFALTVGKSSLLPIKSSDIVPKDACGPTIGEQKVLKTSAAKDAAWF